MKKIDVETDGESDVFNYDVNEPVPHWLLGTIHDEEDTDSELICFGCQVLVTIQESEDDEKCAVITPIGSGTEIFRVSHTVKSSELEARMPIFMITTPTKDQIVAFDRLTPLQVLNNLFKSPLALFRYFVTYISRREFETND